MSRNLLREFMRHLDASGDMKLGHAPPEIKAWLETLALPMDIRRFLQWDWPQTPVEIGSITLTCSLNIMKDEETEKLLKHNFLRLGSAYNGDFFVLDISTEQCRPGFITHEEYFEHEDNPRMIFQPIARSLESLLYRFVERRYVPRDYYDAKDLNEFLREEAGAENPRRPRNDEGK